MPKVRASSGTIGTNELLPISGSFSIFSQHAHERHGRGNFPAIAPFKKFLEEFRRDPPRATSPNAALGNVPPSDPAAREDTDLNAILGWPVKRELRCNPRR